MVAASGTAGRNDMSEKRRSEIIRLGTDFLNEGSMFTFLPLFMTGLTVPFRERIVQDLFQKTRPFSNMGLMTACAAADPPYGLTDMRL